MNKNIGFKIRHLREAQPLSQEAMADKLGISQSTLCKIENGFVDKVDFALMDRICKFFQIDLEFLLNDDSCSQINKDNRNSAISMFGNSTVNNNFPENVIETILSNQSQIKLLLENQNKLIDKLING
jgi:transcriptional regulator with XRE-family HTH domain